MSQNIVLCGHCSTLAIAELEGDYLCSGCLMSVLMCADEPMSVRRINIPGFSDMALKLEANPVYPSTFTPGWDSH